uniref:Large ribosomal subunit protein uL6 n=1 Tax=Tortanus dextrilobatus TaxID=207953 RepID=A0A0U2UHD6_9MAXI|nr:60S ribosomal protein L9 [Tortanus dextrilobatus]
MKEINSFEIVKVPEGLEASLKFRVITVKGPRGSLSKRFKHFALDIYMPDKNTLKVEKWFGKKKQLAVVRTVCSHIQNLFKGVPLGFMYKMRAVYAPFPLKCAISEGGSFIEVRKFLGEKYIRKVRMAPGVPVENSKGQKDELIVTGNCLEDVFQSAALIQQSPPVKNEDIRKFLDGLYVSEKTTVIKEEE